MKSATRTRSGPARERARSEAAARLVAPDVLRRADQVAQRLQAALDGARRTRLDQDVPERRRLDRSGQDGQPRGVRGQPAEQLVPGAATDEVDAVDATPRE